MPFFDNDNNDSNDEDNDDNDKVLHAPDLSCFCSNGLSVNENSNKGDDGSNGSGGGGGGGRRGTATTITWPLSVFIWLIVIFCQNPPPPNCATHTDAADVDLL
jgi:hypothetical protein